MNLVVILQELRRRKIAVGIAVLLSICSGLFVAFSVTPGLPPHLKSRQYTVGVASVRVLVDTPRSIVADLNPSGAASLSIHAQLLADLAASQPIRQAVATEVGIPIQDLAIVPPAIGGAPTVPTPVATALPPPSDAQTLTLSVDPTLPLVSIAAQAPTSAQAARLAAGAVTALRRYLVTVAAAQQIPVSRQPVITSLGALSGTATRGPSRVLAVGAALIVFALLCYGIVVWAGIRRRMAMAALAAEEVPSAAAPIPPAAGPDGPVAAPSNGKSNGHSESPPAFDFPEPAPAPVPVAAPARITDAAEAVAGASEARDGEHRPAPTPAPTRDRRPVRAAMEHWRAGALNDLLGRR